MPAKLPVLVALFTLLDVLELGGTKEALVAGVGVVSPETMPAVAFCHARLYQAVYAVKG